MEGSTITLVLPLATIYNGSTASIPTSMFINFIFMEPFYTYGGGRFFSVAVNQASAFSRLDLANECGQVGGGWAVGWAVGGAAWPAGLQAALSAGLVVMSQPPVPVA